VESFFSDKNFVYDLNASDLQSCLCFLETEYEDSKKRIEIKSFTLLLAARLGHLETAQLLLQNKANIEAKDKNDETPLHFASFNGHLEIVRLLLQNKANIEAKDEFGRTPLYLASLFGHSEIVRILKAHGAK
jgi:ankyrin repeat protein